MASFSATVRVVFLAALGAAACSAGSSDGKPLEALTWTPSSFAASSGQCVQMDGWGRRLSPDGLHLATARRGFNETILLPIEGGGGLRIPDAEALGWGLDGTLWLRGADASIWRWKDGALSSDPDATSVIARKAPARTFGLPGYSPLTSAEGLAVYTLRSNALLRVVDLERADSFRAEIGASWGAVRPITQILVGRSANGMNPMVFTAHEVLVEGPQPAVLTRIEVFDRAGQSVFRAQTDATEVRMLPRMGSRGPLVMARAGAFRCVYDLSVDGSLSPLQTCDRDLANVILDETGRPQAEVYFDKYASFSRVSDSLLEDGSSFVALGRILPSKTEVFERLSPGGLITLTLRDEAGAMKEFARDYQGQLCRIPNMTVGEHFTAESPAGLVHGALFTPASADLKGIVLYYHGGPDQTVSDVQGALFGELLNHGYAVIGVNFRGTPGYGTAYLRAGYDTDPDGLIQDGFSLLQKVREDLGGTTVPTYLAGSSWGGYLALRALVDPDIDAEGGFIQSGLCDIISDPSNVSFRPTVTYSLGTVGNPSVPLHQLRMAGRSPVAGTLNRCDAALPERRKGRVIVVHARNDPITSFAPMQDWAERSGVGAVELVTIESAQHPAPARDDSAAVVRAAVELWEAP